MKKTAFILLVALLCIVVPALAILYFQINWILSLIVAGLVNAYLAVRYFKDTSPLEMMESVEETCGFLVGLAIFILFGAIYWYVSAASFTLRTTKKFLWTGMSVSTA